MINSKPKGKRGFASMDPEKQRQIASKGGKSAHALGLAHRFTSEEARAAGKKGGMSSGSQHRWTPEEAQAAGRKGALTRKRKLNQRKDLK
ncbi:KGG domain-containing protein [Methylocaldum sp.]|uniref:KGG domain-containing protein n=1 Tax=Methylocaldum sp. TaxID=1969727 RepID=UPI002D36A37E|nr:KGG domain-containing protein [Methylocaldum sp.]HYE38180.1 KGG domain-containing protein [Methylocaldum sp.]